MQQSMLNFWDPIIHPLLEAASAKHIVEIGSADGEHTRALLDYCIENHGTLHAIDPDPAFDSALWESQNPAHFIMHRDLSLNVISRLGQFDTVVVDGDHNWYTVFHELQLIDKHQRSPLILLHDVGWPYAYRDMYCVPSNIPDMHRKVWVRKGVVKDKGSPVAQGGLNPHCMHAIEEHNYRNGVRSAVEDFLHSASTPYVFTAIEGFFGLGILVPETRLQSEKALSSFMQALDTNECITSHINKLEEARITQQLTIEEQQVRLEEQQVKLHEQQVKLHEQQHLLETSKSIEKQLQYAHAQIESDQESLQKMQQEIAKRVEHLKRMQQSKSWRYTKFMRYFGTVKKKRNVEKPIIKHEAEPTEQSSPTAHRVMGCTIIAKNFLAQARVLASSFLQHHPDAEFFVLVVDDESSSIEYSQEDFTAVHLKDIHLEKQQQLCFQYTCRELCTAVKPRFLQYLLQKNDGCMLCYLDPDIQVFQPFHAVWQSLESAHIALTPHILSPIDDRHIRPSEKDFLQVGNANLGFIAVRNTSEVQHFLEWWQDRLIDNCFELPDKGMFFDQKWVDLAPGLFDNITYIRDPGYNMAFWNLHERTLEYANNIHLVNGTPLVFYHFSGYRPEDPDTLCLYNMSTHRFGKRRVLRSLFDSYTALLNHNGYAQMHQLPYAYDNFDDGTPITLAMRRCFHALESKRSRFCNPFSVNDFPSFFDWLNTPAQSLQKNAYLTKLHKWIYEQNDDIRQHFPCLKGDVATAFGHWLLDDRQKERNELAPIFLTSLQSLLHNPQHKSLLHRLASKRDHLRIYRLIVQIAKRILPNHMSAFAKKRIQRLDLPIATLHPENAEERDPLVADGQLSVTVAGYLTSENGVGEAARGTVRSIQKKHIPLQLFDVAITSSRREDSTYTDDCIPFEDLRQTSIGIFHVNADQVEVLQPQYFPCDYKIGYWYWELPDFPDQYHAALTYFDELWVGSMHCKKSIETAADIPVHCLPPCIEPLPVGPYTREHFGIGDQFVFLFIFDFLSIPERKNPLAIIEAFSRAFTQNENVLLVIKCVHMDSDPVYASALRKACEPLSCIIIDEYMSTQEIHDLMHCCNTYISLHRCEGFGLTMAQAMAIGKPVIATNYSSNTDFMNEHNSFPIPYTLTTLQKDYGPYTAGNSWADPDIHEAIRCMRSVYDHPENALRIGNKAATDIQLYYSSEATSRLIEDRLLEIHNARR